MAKDVSGDAHRAPSRTVIMKIRSSDTAPGIASGSLPVPPGMPVGGDARRRRQVADFSHGKSRYLAGEIRQRRLRRRRSQDRAGMRGRQRLVGAGGRRRGAAAEAKTHHSRRIAMLPRARRSIFDATPRAMPKTRSRRTSQLRISDAASVSACPLPGGEKTAASRRRRRRKAELSMMPQRRDRAAPRYRRRRLARAAGRVSGVAGFRRFEAMPARRRQCSPRASIRQPRSTHGRGWVTASAAMKQGFGATHQGDRARRTRPAAGGSGSRRSPADDHGRDMPSVSLAL